MGVLGLEQIKQNVSQLKKLYLKFRTLAKESDIKRYERQVYKTSSSIIEEGDEIRAALNQIKILNQQEKQGKKVQTPTMQARINL